jgi:predicted unusual protein kinase regulating ubiquinone biosynthesis (AarF/ABC1/UbiB family)
MSKPAKKLKRGAVPRGIAATLAGIRAGGALAVDGAVKQVLSRSGLRGAETESEFARREARRFVKELGKLKGTYVKIGQIFALLGEHFLPPALTDALHELGGRTEPLPWDAVAPVVEADLGPRIEDLDIDPVAFAAASLAQVHRATVRATEEQIVLKVQYPGLAEVIDGDFDAVVRMLRLARWLPAGRDMDDWLESMRAYLHHEIDYAREARFADWVGARLAGLGASAGCYHAPRVYPEYSSDRVLALEYVSGKMVTDPAIARLSLSRRNAMARAMLELFFIELYDWGVLQTDPNFGNYLLQPDRDGDRLVLLDFGSMLDCSADFLHHLRRVIAAGLEEDVDTLVDGLIGLGCLQPDAEAEGRELFANFCLHLLEPLRRPEHLPAERLNRRGEYRWADSRLMQRAGRLAAASTTSRHFTTPSRDFALIARKLTGVFTFISVLGAEFNGYELVAGHIHRWREQTSHG